MKFLCLLKGRGIGGRKLRGRGVIKEVFLNERKENGNFFPKGRGNRMMVREIIPEEKMRQRNRTEERV